MSPITCLKFKCLQLTEVIAKKMTDSIIPSKLDVGYATLNAKEEQRWDFKPNHKYRNKGPAAKKKMLIKQWEIESLQAGRTQPS